MKTREEFHASCAVLAREAFSRHEIVERSDRRWMIQRPNESMYWTEIVVTRPGLFVSGDIEYALFERFYDSSDPHAVVAWIGKHEEIESYVVKKAESGSGDKITYVRRPDVLADDIRRGLDRRGAFDKSERASLRMALRRLREETADPHVVVHLMGKTKLINHWETIAEWGRVIDPRVFYAHAAVRRLHLLLEKEKEVRNETADR